MMMAVHATGAVAVESPYRRKVYHAAWKFDVGQDVEFGEMTALVLSRQRSAMGRELYLLWIMTPCGGRPHRWVLGKVLKPR
jgi:hypothetical protein